MKFHEFSALPWQTRNKIIEYYGLHRSALIKVRDLGQGVNTIDDDGIREQDLVDIAHLTLEQVVNLTPLSEVPKSIIEEPKAEPEVSTPPVEPKSEKPKKTKKK